jgi:putative membrane protein
MNTTDKSHNRYLLILVLLFAFEAVLLAISPIDRAAWVLENVLTIVFVVVILATHNVFPLSRISYTLIFLFLLLHELGAHYTYAKVPYDQWWQTLFGFSLNESLGFERNHFDRLVHFSYGLLLAYPIREIFIRIAGVRGFWGYFLPLDLTMSTSMMFELFEWAAAEAFGGDLAMDYLGIQGDIWDAHKDMALASLGAFLAMMVAAVINITLQKGFSREWSQSLTIKRRAPLGEEQIQRYIDGDEND